MQATIHDSANSSPTRSNMISARTRRIVLFFVIATLFLAAAVIYRLWPTVQIQSLPATSVQPVMSAGAVRSIQPAPTVQSTPPASQGAGRFGVALTTQQMIDQMQQRIEKNKQDYDAYAQLGLLFLQRVRSGADAADYQRADQALTASLALEPNEVDALVGKGILALALHHFREGLEWGKKAQTVNPLRPDILGIMVDAHVELGEYDEAVTVLQQMVDMRPGVNSYSRVAYLRELYGDVDGAEQVMKMAAEVGLPGDEPTLWTTVQLGNLYFNRGDLKSAEAIYQSALDQSPSYVYAMAGMAGVRAGQGRTDEAIAQYRAVVKRIPLPQFVISLGELLEATGDQKGAQEQYDLVGVVQTLNAAAGMNVDLEMALFDSDHGKDMTAALTQAKAAYHERRTIYAADVLAWALYRNGKADEAAPYMKEAMRLNTQDARLFYHAGMIALAQGDLQAARRNLQHSLAVNPYFSPLYGPLIQDALAKLQ